MRFARILFAVILVVSCFDIALSQSGWVRQNSGTDQVLHSVTFFDNTSGTVCGDDRTILRTTDSGQNWNLQLVSPLVSFYGVSFSDSMNGVATGNNGAIVSTTNGGENWNTVQDGWWLTFNAAFQLDTLWACVVGSNSIFQPMINVTIDGWQTQNSYIFYLQHGGNHEGNLRDVHFFDQYNGYAAAMVWNGEGAIVRTTDGGVNWETAYWGNNVIYALDFPTPDTGYAVGFGGTALKTTDAGFNWTELNVGYAVELLDVSFAVADTGTAVGAFGFILRTVDGGQTWDLQDAGITAHLRGVDFPSANIGYAVGDSGIIMYTVTGGEVPPPCDYAPGDVNGSGLANGLDVVYLVAYFKGGDEPPLSCICGTHGNLFAAADANGSCDVNGLDVTYMITYYKGGPAMFPCPDCPPAL